MSVSELMTPGPVEVRSDTPIATCALRMEQHGIRHLPVVDADGALVGIVTDADIHRHGAIWGGAFAPYDPGGALAAGDLACPVEVTARPDDDLPSLVRRLAATRQDCIVVLDEGRQPVGIVTEQDLLGMVLLMVPERLTVAGLPARTVITGACTELGSAALDTMSRNHIRHLPVTGPDGTVLGIVSYRDLVAADVRRRPVTLDEVRIWEVFTASPEDTLVKCAARMRELRIGSLPVIAGGRAVRMVTRRDLIDAAVSALEDESLFDGEA